MMRSLEIGGTGMLAQQLNVDVISNNIANVTTTGYKRQSASFQDLIYQDIIRPGSSSSDANTTVPAGIQLGLGVKTASVYRSDEQGTLKPTSDPLDVAITGKGFFQIKLPSGDTAYTRDGTFQMNQNGELVTVQGYLIQPAISIPKNATEVDINASGQVDVKVSGQTNVQNVGQIQLAAFVNPAGLDAIGNNLLMETEASGAPTTGNPQQNDFGNLTQASLEQSNVNVVQEITNLITAQRSYEMNSNVIKSSDEMLQTITQIR